MSEKTFRKALDMCEDDGASIFIGGGEPTIHPKFEKFLLLAIASGAKIGEGQVGIITNGKLTERAMMLANLRQGGIIYSYLSKDAYHDPISDEVNKAFADHIWNTTSQRDVMPHGRGRELLGEDEDGAIERDETDCPCTDTIIKPDGTIVQCGCDDSPVIGHVDTGIDTPVYGECCRSRAFVNACIENGLDSMLV